MKPRIEQKLEVEYKYYLDILKWLSEKNAISIFPMRKIYSIYLDTLDYKMYFDTSEGIVPRKKIRLRKYNNFDIQNLKNFNLEIKLTTSSKRYKSVEENINLKEIVSEGYYDKDYGFCYPVVNIMNEREYFKIENYRLTFDKNIRYKFLKNNKGKYNTFSDEKCVFEIKCDANENLSNLLNFFDFPRTRFSKYERALDHLYNKI